MIPLLAGLAGYALAANPPRRRRRRARRNPARDILAYHATLRPYRGLPTITDGFSIHCGTLEAAEKRITGIATKTYAGDHSGARVYRLRLRPRLVLECRDAGLWNEAVQVYLILRASWAWPAKPVFHPFWEAIDGVLSHEDIHASFTTAPTVAWNTAKLNTMRTKLIAAGVDVLKYKNKFEAKGSTSYAVLDPGIIVGTNPPRQHRTARRNPTLSVQDTAQDFLRRYGGQAIGWAEDGAAMARQGSGMHAFWLSVVKQLRQKLNRNPRRRRTRR